MSAHCIGVQHAPFTDVQNVQRCSFEKISSVCLMLVRKRLDVQTSFVMLPGERQHAVDCVPVPGRARQPPRVLRQHRQLRRMRPSGCHLGLGGEPSFPARFCQVVVRVRTCGHELSRPMVVDIPAKVKSARLVQARTGHCAFGHHFLQFSLHIHIHFVLFSCNCVGQLLIALNFRIH